MKKKLDFTKKWIIVTGAARGLGRDMTKHLVLSEGARVIAMDIKEEELIALASEMDEYIRGSVVPITADLSNREEVEKIFSKIEKSYTIFGLINNAGLTHYGPTERDNLETYEKIVEINFLAAVNLTLLAVEHFKKNNQGYILNITSLGGFIPLAYQNVYSATKQALMSFSQALAEELRKTDIGISIYAPGGMKTDMIREAGLADHFKSFQFGILDSKVVARKAIEGMKNRREFNTAGPFDHIYILFSKMVPGRFSRKMMSQLYKPAVTL